MRHEAEQLPLPMDAQDRTEVLEVDGADLAQVLADVERRGLWASRLECVGVGSSRLHVTTRPRPRPDAAATPTDHPLEL